jgi:hypothetical protein
VTMESKEADEGKAKPEADPLEAEGKRKRRLPNLIKMYQGKSLSACSCLCLCMLLPVSVYAPACVCARTLCAYVTPIPRAEHRTRLRLERERMLLLREERMREDLERFLMESEDRSVWVVVQLNSLNHIRMKKKAVLMRIRRYVCILVCSIWYIICSSVY